MSYVFAHAIPASWLIADIVTLVASVAVFAFIIKKSAHPVSALLEGLGFMFLYAGIFENFAVVQGWYVYGRSLVMFADVPLSIPLMEMDVLLLALWMLDAMEMPQWAKPFVAGLMGMLQDFSLDPVAVRQIASPGGIISGRWTWLLPQGAANIYGIPVYNWPGWMLIMLYAAVWISLGRFWHKKSGSSPVVGILYPILAAILSLATMVSPLSQFLLWLWPIGAKGGSLEWVMLCFHLALPTVLLAVLWRGRMKRPMTLRTDLPVFLIPAVFHVMDVIFAAAGGYTLVMPLVLVSSAVHVAILAVILARGMAAGKTLRAGAPAPA
jgi:hypothetical protein